ncbi:MAG: hypothetical protein M3M96_04375 [Candidatus Eremiobacteraeota bacterium]|nr:hypothetical protein [Candidatus Eremiobacteraeota bacterium]
MWYLIGLAASLGLAIAAWRRDPRRAANPFEREVYGMEIRTHKAYALAGAAFAALFAAGLVWPNMPAVPILAVFAVFAILYWASFVRGASGEDE